MAYFDLKQLMSREWYGFDERVCEATERTNLMIDLAWWDRWMGNFRTNMESVGRLPALSQLYGAWDGADCIVAGAGPSLAENIYGIRRAVEKGWKLVAVDRAYGVLRRGGLRPDLTITCDADEKVSEFFEAELLAGDDVFGVCVISHPSVFEKLGGCDVRVFGCANPFSGFWRFVAGRCGDGVMCVRPGYVVTFSAVDAAVWMGARRVLTVGNELCWRREGEVDDLNRGLPIVELESGVVTVSPFVRAARAFRFFPVKCAGVDFVDVSGGLDKGWRVSSFKEECGGGDDLKVNREVCA